MAQKYNNNAAAMTWEILNDQEDIGKFEILYEGNLIKGVGFEEFLSAANNISDNINVIYIKYLKWFVHISQKFIDYEGKRFFANGDRNFYYIQISDNIELRDWDNFFDRTDSKEEFLSNLNNCRKNFNSNPKRRNIKDTYNFSLAREMWEDIKYKYFLNAPWAVNYCIEMLPKTQEELEILYSLNKASFFYQSNQNWYDGRAYNVHCYDLSSSHLSFLARKRFPYEGFKEGTDGDEIQKIISEKKCCWYAKILFKKLQYKIDFPINLQKFGGAAPEFGQCAWIVYLTNVDMEWFKQVFTWDEAEVFYFYYAKQRELCKNYATMFEDLYFWKNSYEKGTFAKQISKFRAELPYGQPMKNYEYAEKTIYNSETKSFEVVENEEKTFEEIKENLSKRGIPVQVSFWVAAYSRLEEFTIINRIGLDSIVYGDTDSVKFIGEKGIEVIKERNEEIKKEFEKINNKRFLYFPEKLGKWEDEGNLACFKSIGIKWYLTIDMDGKVDVKAAGANTEALKNYLKEKQNPTASFGLRMKVDKMFSHITPSRKVKHGIVFQYQNKMDSEFKKELGLASTMLYYYNPYEEKEELK